MKHTIKLLTLAFMLATILTLTGCPGPVNTETPCTHENKKTVIETAATCTETGLEKIICADCGELIEENTIEALGHDFDEWTVTKEATCTADGEETRTCKREGCTHSETRSIEKHHTWELESDTATCATDGIKTYKCSRCNETRTEDSPAHHTFIAGGCDICGAFEHNETDDYQITAYVYSSVDDVNNNNYTELYFSFPKNVVGNEYITFKGEDPQITIDDLIHLKNGYGNNSVLYYCSNLEGLLIKEYQHTSKFLKNLDSDSPIYIVIK